MRVLLDTHVWLWWLHEPGRLSADTIALLAERGNTVYLSAASVWEIVIKHNLGKLTLPAPPDKFVPQAMADDGLAGLAIEHAHVLRVGHLPRHHRDPFDRVLIAQAQVEDLPLLTADPLFEPYDVAVLKAD
jgi:PIN domain nuclease of toxin-antitoxin system